MPRKKIPSAQDPPAAFGQKAADTAHAVCRNIKRFRERAGMEQKDLAGRIGVTPNAVSNWETGRSRPDFNLLPGLCAALEATPYELLGMQAPASRYTDGERLLVERYRALAPGHKLAVDGLVNSLSACESGEKKAAPVRKLIFYGRPLSAGPGDPSEFDGQESPIFLYASRQVDRADCVFPVNGDSMEPAYHSGDMVLVSRIPDAPSLRDGEVGAFISGNETYIKVYRKDGLHSLNPAYAPMKFGEDAKVYLIGRVIGTLDPEQIASQKDAASAFAAKEL